MILIDALYINYGGALSLLRYLVETLLEKKVDFYLLADDRCCREFDTLAQIEYRRASLSERRSFYKDHMDDYASVFCFGNVPPPFRLKVPVYTYFHNINMLTLTDCRDKKQLIKFWLKRAFIKHYRKNTDEWFVQTSNTSNELIRHLGVSSDKVKLYPFYKLPQFPKADGERTDYIFVGEYSGSKGHDELLEAWRMLHEQGSDLTLHLTVSLGDAFLRKLQDAIEQGVHIVNHGFIPVEELANLYVQCKATIYPSFNESFGLGLIEAMEAGCDVIASDRPFVHAICKPSETFDPALPNTIVDAVVRYETKERLQTILTVCDKVDKMIEEICKK